MINNDVTHINTVQDEVALKEVFSPLWTRRWKIVCLTLVVTCIVAFYSSLLKPSYQASAILQIGSNKPSNTLSINDAFNESSASLEQIQTQYELLRSRKFAERVITRLNLTEHEEFNSGKFNDKLGFLAELSRKKEAPSIEQVVAEFHKRLKISPIPGTELVKITFTSYFPELSRQVANQIGQTYLHYQDEIHRASKESTSQWLVDQLEQLGRKLEASELALQAYREEQGIVDIRGVAGLVSAELTELTSAALRMSKEVDDLKVTYDYVQKHKNSIDQLLELQEITNKPAFSQLRVNEERAERKLNELSQRYGPKHPKRIVAQADLDAIRTNMTETVSELVMSLEKGYLNALEKVKGMNQRLEEAKQQYLRLTRLQNKFSQLEREVDTNKELYSNYLVRLKEADAMGNYKANFYVRFIDKAITPKHKAAPNRSLMVIMSFILAFAVISIVVIMRELLMDTLNSRRKLESFTDAAVLAVLPKFKTKTKKSQEPGYHTDNRFLEAVRTLRTALLFNSEQKPPKVIAITSSLPNEGKTTVALQLARSFSEMEKVLLIEADMRHPTVYKNLDLEPHRPGLSNLLAKTHQINECIIRDSHVKLDILTSGITPANPLAFLSMKRFNMLIKVFGNFYDRIIIETPPVNAVSDAVIISRNVDSVLYVVHGGKTKRDQISSGLRLLKQANAPVQGVVINQSENIDPDKYHNKYYNDMANIIKLPLRKQG
ncbi:GumC family protein [Thalassotalea sediminis]|uniref:GumC family protein n=1 Tax=Thalassotalea sediminis TaxID=1759089 RepID=UPI0025735267|nr:polysaccharide biosynthesis tyrosine autokinase [Thalassotalea sediminis]